ncbi:hypothetical protein A2U01_0006040 [Trifolium medium]|uniref:Uncharacterized protein n=1 Tax=Trifolium medium TaxID=97028 RepID=A0A392MCL2_9FABA|nr:hypothetical protein [Trifolium medium]
MPCITLMPNGRAEVCHGVIRPANSSYISPCLLKRNRSNCELLATNVFKVCMKRGGGGTELQKDNVSPERSCSCYCLPKLRVEVSQQSLCSGATSFVAVGGYRADIPSDDRSGKASAADGCLPSNDEVNWASRFTIFLYT